MPVNARGINKVKIVPSIQLRKGNTIIIEDELFTVIDHSFNKTAMREGIVKCHLKNLVTGSITVVDLTGKKVEVAMVLKEKAFFSHLEHESLVFYSLITSEEFRVNKGDFPWESNFMFSGLELPISRYGDHFLGLDLPEHIEATISKIDETGGGSKGRTGILESGFRVLIPDFVQEGDVIKIGTKKGDYKSR